MRSVLYVDDRDEELQSLRLKLAGSYRVHTCHTGADARELVRRLRPSAVILDIDMPGYNGFRVLSDIRSLSNPPPVMMLSGHDDPLHVVRAMKEGAADFIAKPCFPAILNRRLSMLIGSPIPVSTSSHVPIRSPLAGSSALMCALRADLQRFAATHLPVLILGESGTGKDLAAKTIHYESARAAGPFEIRNISSIPDTLLSAELFGSDEGAFTDASRRPGCFEQANGGTLFLDEIADASLSCQASLLRVVEDGQVRRLGSSSSQQMDCRLITATNKDLDLMVADHTFRDDLRWRLDVLTVRMPPLRAHREDIPELAQSLLAGIGTGLNVSEDAMDRLCMWNWPGNVRELRTCLERASVSNNGGVIDARCIDRALGIQAAGAAFFPSESATGGGSRQPQ